MVPSLHGADYTRSVFGSNPHLDACDTYSVNDQRFYAFCHVPLRIPEVSTLDSDGQISRATLRSYTRQ